jgi:hypothetical protein
MFFRSLFVVRLVDFGFVLALPAQRLIVTSSVVLQQRKKLQICDSISLFFLPVTKKYQKVVGKYQQ